MVDITQNMKSIPKGRWIRVIPSMIIIYIVAYMDRMNISVALAGGMNKALGLSMTLSGLASGIFFVGYLILQVPGGHIARHGNAKKFVFYSILAWGITSFANGFVQNEWQLLVMRFLLGVAEGGLWPAILVLISNWFPAKETGRAFGFFESSAALSAIVSNPFTGWIIAEFGWRWVFFIEGLISFALIFMWMPIISNHPQDSKWLSKSEKNYLVQTLSEEREAFKHREKVAISYTELLKDPELWKLSLIYLCYQIGQYGFQFWLPTIIKQLTKTGILNVGLLSAIPYILALVGLYIFSTFSDRSMNYRKHTIITLCGFAIVFWISTQVGDHVWISYLALVLTGLFTKSTAPVFWAMPRILFAPDVSGAAIGIINAIGNLGGFVGPFLVGWLATTYGFNVGIYSLIFFLLAGAVITFFMPKITAGIQRKTIREELTINSQ